MEKITYPHRVRLHRGRNAHAAREEGSSGYMGRRGANHWLPATEAVTCPGCKRAMAKAGA